MQTHDSIPAQPRLAAGPPDVQAQIAARNRAEVDAGQRFAFGRNWRRFLASVDDTRIAAAEESLCARLQVDDLRGRSFLDVGTGSGLFSLAALRLGAAAVRAFDCDPECVACAAELKRRYLPTADQWGIECGDVLSPAYLATLGRYDVVYSWGVLHQTGDLWRALANVVRLVERHGLLYLSIYNHQPLLTPCWTAVKRTYNWLPRGCRWPLVGGYLAVKTPLLLAREVLLGRAPWAACRGVGRRGMSLYYDAVDWVGGYPHQTATPESVFRFCRDRGFRLLELSTVHGGSGCNEFVFQRAT